MINNQFRYGHIAVGLHWLTVLLLIVIYASTEGRFLPETEEATDLMKLTHYSLGLSLLLLAILRFTVKIHSPEPEIYPPIEPHQRFFAKAGHWALYAFLIGMPLCGWLYLSVRGFEVPFFAWTIPLLMERQPEFISAVKYLHYYAGTAGYFLIAGHSLAAIYHHFIRGDNTLVRMMVKRRLKAHTSD